MINRLIVLCMLMLCACRAYKDTGNRSSLSERELAMIDQAKSISSIAELPGRIRNCRFFKGYTVTADSSEFMSAADNASLLVCGAYLPRGKCGYVLLKHHHSASGSHDTQCVLFHAQGDSINIDIYSLAPGIRTWQAARPWLIPGNAILFWGYTATEKEARKMRRQARRAKH